MDNDFKDIWGNLTLGTVLLLFYGLTQPLVANFGLINLPLGLVGNSVGLKLSSTN